MYDFAIIGAGVTGAMLARELTRYQVRVCVLEKENDVACGASKANSGIIHGGYDPEPGTLKAKLNTVGVEKLFAAAKELNVPHKRNGSFVCAFSPEEDATIRALYARGQENRIPDLEILSGDQARQLEPALSKEVTSVLHVPTAGIICPYSLTIAAMGNAMDNGADLKTNFAVSGIRKEDGAFTVTSQSGEQIRAKQVINCAGGYADRIAKLAGDDFFTVIPRAGEYLLLDKTEGTRVSHTIFQVPSAEGKGILVSPTVHGNLLLGPTAVQVDTPACKGTTADGLDTVVRLALKSVPSAQPRSVITSFTGVRASCAKGDFIIERSRTMEGLLHVGAIDSPGLTCCVAIAEYVVGLLGQLPINPDFDGHRADTHAFQNLSDQEKDAYIKANPEYGKIVCRCETVSEGEILAAIRTNPPARDLDGVKRRVRAGMGRCQGGFCAPHVMALIAQETGIGMEAVTKNGGESYMLVGKL